MPSTYDYNPSLVPLNVISVCYQAPSADYDENCFHIVRCADIINGELKPFVKDPNFPARNSNRFCFYPKTDLPGMNHPWGVWDLKAIPKNDGREYKIVTYHRGSMPIIVHRLSSQTPVLDQLTSAVLAEEFDCPIPLPVLFTYRIGKKLCGIHIRPDQVEKDSDGQFKLVNIWSLPQYELDERAIIKLNGTSFWKYLSLESHAAAKPERLFVTPPVLALAEAIESNYGSWKQFQLSFAGEKRDHKILNSLVELLKKPDLQQQINAHYQLSTEDFELVKAELVENAGKYLKSLDIGSDVLLNAALRRPGMEEALGQAAESKWREEHSQELETAKKELQELKDSAAKAQNQIKTLSGQRDAVQARLEKVKSQRIEEEKLLKLVAAQLGESLQDAQTKFASMLADLPFRLALQQPLVKQYAALPEDIGAQTDKEAPEDKHTDGKQDVLCYDDNEGRKTSESSVLAKEAEHRDRTSNEPRFAAVELPRPRDNIAVAADADEWLKAAGSVLQATGIKSRFFSEGMTKLVVAAALNGMPLLLAGPNSAAIARTLSLVLTGMPPSVVNLDEVNTEEALASIEKWPDRVGYSALPPVVLFRNAMSGSRLSTLLDDWRLSRCTPLISTAFTEEIALFPQAILNSVFPVLTELFLGEQFRVSPNPRKLRRADDDVVDFWRQQSVADTAVPSAIDRVRLPALARRRHEFLMAQAGGLYEKQSAQDAAETFLVCLASASVLLSESPAAAAVQVKTSLLPLMHEKSAEALDEWLGGLVPEALDPGAES